MSKQCSNTNRVGNKKKEGKKINTKENPTILNLGGVNTVITQALVLKPRSSFRELRFQTRAGKTTLLY